MRMLLFVAVVFGASGCATLPNGQRWGEDATFRPGWRQLKESAGAAVRDPWVWVPLAGAALLQIDDWDRRTARWARAHTPIFGSQRSAENWSDHLRSASAYVHYATIVATPGGDAPIEWLLAKTRGALVQAAAVSLTSFSTNQLKSSVDRERPNGLSRQSFPSGHTSSSAVHTRLASRNLDTIDMPQAVRTSFDVGLHVLTIGTSWSRIEAGWHHPGDTLVGMALGYFTASFINDAFLGLDSNRVTIALVPAERGYVLQWAVRF